MVVVAAAAPAEVSPSWLVLDLVRSRGWRCEYECGDRVTPVPESAACLFPSQAGEPRTLLTVWPDPELEWIIRLYAEDEIVSDVDLHQIQGQDRLDAFCRLLQTLGDALRKEICVYSEGDNTYPPMMAYDVATGRVVFLAGPW